MSNRSSYTSQEWKTLLLAPVQSGIAVMLSEKSGFIGTAQEMVALYKEINKNAAQHYTNNPLVQALLSSDNTDEYKAVVSQIANYIKDASARQKVETEAVQTCHNASEILKQKATPQEAEGYKKWLMEVCNNIAVSATEQGQKVSPAEEREMRTIASALA